ncbi:MAG: DUF1559 domain-containing protein [Planctomycetales bacterium]|nr:DUF1559 domain-containing protein [Planctomycetales bacterium]
MRNTIFDLPPRGVQARRLNVSDWPLKRPALRLPPLHGFTLVELLVVITIIGIMLALTLPGVMASRESARRMACLNNLTQIGMALANYEAAQESLPSGTIDAEGPVRNIPQGYKMSWLVQILPYLDEKVLFDQIDFSVGAYNEKNARGRAINVPTFVCPSCGICRITPPAPGSDGQWSSSNKSRAGAGTWTASNYAGCQNGVETPIDSDNDGVLFLNSKVRRDDATDGAAHTIFVGEKLIGLHDLGWMSGTRATLRNTGTPPNQTPGDSSSLPVAAKPADDDPDATKPDAEMNDLFVGGFGSCHPDVCNYLFGDGRTDSITNSIDPDVLRKLGDRAGGELIEGGPTRGDWW